MAVGEVSALIHSLTHPLILTHPFTHSRATQINNKSDGRADDLLPNTRLRIAFRDSARQPQAALRAAIELTSSAFQARGVSAIVGAASSSASMSAAQVPARLAPLPLIS